MNDTTSATTATRASSSTATRTATRTTTRRRRGVVGALAAAGLAAVTLTGCSSGVESLASALGADQVQQRHYDTYADAPTPADSTDVAWFLPDWVPADATDIDVRLDTQDPGYELTFDSSRGVDLASCTAVDGDLGGPALAPETLPAGLPTSGLVTCGDGRVVAQVDGRWASWTTVDAAPGDDGSTTLRR